MDTKKKKTLRIITLSTAIICPLAFILLATGHSQFVPILVGFDAFFLSARYRIFFPEDPAPPIVFLIAGFGIISTGIARIFIPETNVVASECLEFSQTFCFILSMLLILKGPFPFGRKE